MPECTAVLCATDAFAFGVFDAMREAGRTPGADVDLVGFDDVESLGVVPYDRPTLTTVNKPRFLMGQKAAAMLVDAIKGSPVSPNQIEVPGTLVERLSCRFDSPGPGSA